MRETRNEDRSHFVPETGSHRDLLELTKWMHVFSVRVLSYGVCDAMRCVIFIGSY